nr:hypothetical protein [Tanacetum cinerariifolium]
MRVEDFASWVWEQVHMGRSGEVYGTVLGFAAVLAVLKPERLKANRARILLFTMCEEASKVESCPSEIILDDLLALDSIVRFDFE